MLVFLFTMFVLIGFGMMVAAHLPGSRLTQLPAWVCWTLAAVIWAIPQLSGV